MTIGRPQPQRGFALVISLILLAVLSLIAASSASLSRFDAQRVSFLENRAAVKDSSLQALEQALSDPAFLKGAATRDLSLNAVNVTVAVPLCTRATTMAGFSLKNPLSLERAYWRLDVSGQDTVSSAAFRARQGIRTIQTAAGCP
ncbi:MAG: hypothetical protein RJQ08_11275 [Salinisphaeraceae bacterium]